MAKENAALDKSFDFAIRAVRVYQYLTKERREYALSKQLVRCSTSIGANINEAQAGQSRNDFIAKMAVASKEARESKYWIDLLIATDYLSGDDANTKTLRNDAAELVSLLTRIVKTSQGKSVGKA